MMAGQQRVVLVVSQDLDLLTHVVDAFRLEGHTVVSALEGEDIAELFRIDVVDLLIVDLSKPFDSRIGRLKKLRAINPNFSIIAFSTSGVTDVDLALRDEFREDGATISIVRPFSLEHLLKNAAEIMTAQDIEVGATISKSGKVCPNPP